MKNLVSYASEVEGYVRRANWALQAQAEAMERRMKFAQEQSAKKAGFKVR